MTDLVKRAKKGDKEAFILLMDHHRQMLYNTALLVLHREDDALDAHPGLLGKPAQPAKGQVL